MSQSVAAPAVDFARVAVAFERWRGSTPVGARIPEALWSRAVELARLHGVGKVARALRLDYVRLKRRLAAQAQSAAPSPPAFVDMTLELPPAGSGCILALSDARGRALRIEWTRPLTGEGAAVACRLWEATA